MVYMQAYAMTKGALNSLQAGIIDELAALGIRCNAVSPGMTQTDMIADSTIAKYSHMVPMRRGARPEEIADTIAFFLSDQASCVSGGNLRVAGGRQMGGSQ